MINELWGVTRFIGEISTLDGKQIEEDKWTAT
jgi:hypothetical protein